MAVKFEAKLGRMSMAEIWQEYCGFLDLSMESYMKIQRRLLEEQLIKLDGCALGRRLFGDAHPRTMEEFRAVVPLTTFEDYADLLLPHREDVLPAPPVTWLKTTWEGGSSPAKTAPYSEGMLATYTSNILAALLLSTSTSRGRFNVKRGERVLYALAPLPYATGLFPTLIDKEISLRFMPSVKEAQKMSFSDQSRVGFKQALGRGIDLFFGMSSIIYGVSRNLSELGNANAAGGLRAAMQMSPRMLIRYLSARYRCKRDNRPMLPRDLFDLKGFVCVGTDSSLYKDELEQFWGIRPLEIAGGTEPSCLGTETWSRDGLVFFPDNCFYEFIPEEEMRRNLADRSYIPQTCLMDELVANECYELVITVLKGGAFARYRVGDVYRCLRLRNTVDKLDLPQFEYVDRVPTVIDILGFTRITERELTRVIELSHLRIGDWFAVKEYDAQNRSFLHLYVELAAGAPESEAVGKQIIREHLSTYFKYYDGDYADLKKILGLDPLRVTILKTGSIAAYTEQTGNPVPHVNPPAGALRALIPSMR